MRYRLRWVLPVAQLLVCVVALWPARGHLLFGLIQAKHFYAPGHQEAGELSERQRVILLPELSPERLRAVNANYENAMQHLRVPVMLNFPVVVAQLPFALATRREWHPQAMPIETWRALFWPFAGLGFWWLAGRGIEALYASFQSTIHPRLRWMEVSWAFILFAVGIVAVIGIVTSTPDDRRDKTFMALMYGGLLWGILAALSVTACFRQWRILRSDAA